MREIARGPWWRMAPLAVLVVAVLPGTTSASFVPVSPADPPVVHGDPAPPILPDITEGHLLPGPPFDLPLEHGSAASEEQAEDDQGLPDSIFEEAQVISIYGYPGICFMGELGCHEPDGAVESLLRIAGEYEVLNEEMETGRRVIPALHLIVDVAQPRPQEDGSYLYRMAPERIAEYVELARERDLLIFLDIQIGWTDAIDGVERLEEFLREPFVHVALDAEFATRSLGRPPGSVIGTLDAPDINEVQHYLANLVREEGLPPKVLVLHKFTPRMLINTDQYETVEEIDLTITMDGYGAPAPKIGGYERYALADYSERAGFKIFWHWDEPVMSPRDVMKMRQAPDYVIYQ
jgi:hypothetical protein